MSDKFTIFVDNRVWSQHAGSVNLVAITSRLPVGWIGFQSDCPDELSPWFDEGGFELMEKDIDPVLRMLVLVLNL